MSEETIYNLIERISERKSGDQNVEGEQYSHSSKGNEWMIKIVSKGGGGNLTESNVENFTDHTLLLDHLFDLSRRTNSNVVAVNKFDSARPRFSNPLIKIPNDTWTPVLENILVNGILVDEISLKRLSNTGQINVIVQQIDFKGNLVQSMVQDDDYVWVEFRTEQYTNTIFRVGQDTQKKGQNSFTYNIAQAHTTLGTAAGSQSNSLDDSGENGG